MISRLFGGEISHVCGMTSKLKRLFLRERGMFAYQA